MVFCTMQGLTWHCTSKGTCLINRSQQQLKQHDGNKDGLLINEAKGLKQPWSSPSEGEEAHLCQSDHLCQNEVPGSVAKLPMAYRQPRQMVNTGKKKKEQ